MIEVRCIDPSDEGLLFEAYDLFQSQPAWLYSAHPVFWLPDFVTFRESAKERLDFGVFDKEMLAVFSLTSRNGSYEVDLAARKGTDPQTLYTAARTLRDELFKCGIGEIFAWVLSKNRGVMRVCRAAGLEPDGVRVLKGALKGKPAEWVRLSCRKGCNHEGAKTSPDAVSEHEHNDVSTDNAAEHAGHGRLARVAVPG